MLLTLIQRYDKKNHFIFDPVQKGETYWIFTSCQMPHFMIVLILYIEGWAQDYGNKRIFETLV